MRPAAPPYSNILIITREDRNYKFVSAHDDNLQQYCRKHRYTYKRFRTMCNNLPVYWCKLQDVRAHLEDYDYVVWLDSDTHINQFDRRLETLISRDITISRDNIPGSSTLNAGFFVIKNSPIGAAFLADCLDYFEQNKEKCVDAEGRIVGKWSGMCYEQGVMNMFLKKKYRSYTHITNEVYNGLRCNNTYMITHLFRSSPARRLACIESAPVEKSTPEPVISEDESQIVDDPAGTEQPRTGPRSGGMYAPF